MDKEKMNAAMQAALKLISLKKDEQQYILGYIDGAFEVKLKKDKEDK